MTKKTFSILICFCTIALNISLLTFAETDGLIILGGRKEIDFKYFNDNLTIMKSGIYSISNINNKDTLKNGVTVDAKDGEVKIILDGVNIDTSSKDSIPAINITGECKTTLIAANKRVNKIKSGLNSAGIQKSNPNENTLIIGCEHKDEPGHKCDSNCGTLEIVGGCNGAGIGGGKSKNGENIKIEGGNINSYGGIYASGVGGGSNGNGNNICITNGNVKTCGGMHASGIGGGTAGSGNNINISGGNITSNGGIFAAGIGGGNGGDGQSVIILNGHIITNGGKFAAGIGGGCKDKLGNGGNGNNLLIINGNITATGGDSAAGIGGGEHGDGIDIEIKGGHISSTGGTYGGAAIGGGFAGKGYYIRIGDGASLLSVKGGLYAQTIGNGNTIIKKPLSGIVPVEACDKSEKKTSNATVKKMVTEIAARENDPKFKALKRNLSNMASTIPPKKMRIADRQAAINASLKIGQDKSFKLPSSELMMKRYTKLIFQLLPKNGMIPRGLLKS